MTIRVHVERLTLEGLTLAGADRARLERAVVAELTRLLGEAHARDASLGGALGSASGGALAGGAVPALPAAAVQLRAGDSAASLGTQVARSVYGALVPPAADREAPR